MRKPLSVSQRSQATMPPAYARLDTACERSPLERRKSPMMVDRDQTAEQSLLFIAKRSLPTPSTIDDGSTPPQTAIPIAGAGMRPAKSIASWMERSYQAGCSARSSIVCQTAIQPLPCRAKTHTSRPDTRLRVPDRS